MSNFTRSYYGASVAGASATGASGGVSPLLDGAFSGKGDYVSELSTAKTRGARVLLRFYGSANNVKDGNSAFSVAMWKDEFDTFAARAPAAQIRNFWADGTLLALYGFDDITSASVFPGGGPTFEEVEECCQYAKSILTFLPIMARHHNIGLREMCVDAGASHYSYLDFGLCQWHRRQGAAQTWFTNNVNAGRLVKLGCACGINILNGGSGLTSPWDIHPEEPAPQFGCSPQEIDATTQGFSTLTTMIGYNVWAQNPQFDENDYWHYTGIQAALQRIADVAIDRPAGPINWRDISGSTSGSTVTVAGGWGLVHLGEMKRYANSATQLDIPEANNESAGNLHCILVHVRDSTRTVGSLPGWVEAQRISGTSGQGGELVLFFKIGGPVEPAVTVPLLGPETVGNGAMGRRFVFSHASSNLLTVLATTGSVRSWASKTGMGPVAGITSTISDALILICAARCNDFGGGSVDENNMSATTGPQSWNRMFCTGSASAHDQGMFVDWAATSGIASITTKTWSQISGTEGAAGCGFMLAFAPLSIVSGQPPAITGDLEDVTVSIGSNLSFTLQSSGSTPITWSKESGPSNVTLNTSTGRFDFTPTGEGPYFIILRATNAFGFDEEGFTVTVGAGGGGEGNTAPSITHPGDFTVRAQSLLAFGVSATDADGDPLTYGLEAGAPAGAMMDPSTGQFIWVPTGEQGPGTYPIVAVVEDGQVASRSTFTVTVADVPWTKGRPSSGGFGGVSSGGNSFRRI